MLEPLMEAAPAFGRFGKLCAIEIFNAIGDRRAADVLIPWLEDEDESVRENAAQSLGWLGATEAVPQLQVAWAASKERSTPPSWTGQTYIRHALAALGAREVVLPEAAARLEASGHDWDRAWPVAALPEVLDHLAAAGQVVPYVQYWTRRPELNPDAWYGLMVDQSYELDWSLPWDELVRESHQKARAAAAAVSAPSETVVTIEWLDRSDV